MVKAQKKQKVISSVALWTRAAKGMQPKAGVASKAFADGGGADLYEAIERRYRDRGYTITVTRRAGCDRRGTISRTEIWNRLCLVLDPRSKRQIYPNTPLPKGGTKSSLAYDINHYPPFEEDCVFLMPGDLRMATVVLHAAAAIAGWYRSNNWTVT